MDFTKAVDYTPSRLPSPVVGRSGERAGVNVRQFMAHHEGMSLLALAYLLLDKPMQRRFEADPVLRAADLFASGACAQDGRADFPHVAEASTTQSDIGRRGTRDAGLHGPRRSGPRGPLAFQWPVSRDDHQCGRRLQPGGATWP